LSVSEDRTVQSTPVTVLSTPGIADPGPLGLAAFALTTFLLSAHNANWMTHALGFSFLGFAFFYGGVVQILAGMWEIRNKNVFGGLVFSSFGGFWIGLGFWLRFQAIPALTAAAAHPLTLPTAAATVNHDLGWILLAWAIFTTYLLVQALQLNTATLATIFLLWATLIILTIGNFELGSATTSGIIQTGGYVGVVTAASAWYTSWAGLSAGMAGKIRLPLGPPLLKP
jgi:uncharacterized protein